MEGPPSPARTSRRQREAVLRGQECSAAVLHFLRVVRFTVHTRMTSSTNDNRSYLWPSQYEMIQDKILELFTSKVDFKEISKMQRNDAYDFSTTICWIRRLEGWLFIRDLDEFALTHSSPPPLTHTHILKVFAIPYRNSRKLHRNLPLTKPAFPEKKKKTEKINEFNPRWAKVPKRVFHFSGGQALIFTSGLKRQRNWPEILITFLWEEGFRNFWLVTTRFCRSFSFIDRVCSDPSEAVYRCSWLLLKSRAKRDSLARV